MPDMFGFKRKEWKHARKSGFDFFRELLAAVCLVFLIAAAWVSLETSGQKTTELPTPAGKTDTGTTGDTTEPETLFADFAEFAEPAEPKAPPYGGPDDFDKLDKLDKLDRPDGFGPAATPGISGELDSMDAMKPRAHAMDIASLVPTLAPQEAKQTLTVVVEKKKHLLTVYEGNEAVKTYRVAVGMKPGKKSKAGDMRTPEGTFTVQKIHNSGHWVHDFGDGNGAIAGAYGPLFIRLHTPPWNGIGIHGTHDPGSLGLNATEGCVRMKNDDLLELAGMIDVGTSVVIR